MELAPWHWESLDEVPWLPALPAREWGVVGAIPLLSRNFLAIAPLPPWDISETEDGFGIADPIPWVAPFSLAGSSCSEELRVWQAHNLDSVGIWDTSAYTPHHLQNTFWASTSKGDVPRLAPP